MKQKQKAITINGKLISKAKRSLNQKQFKAKNKGNPIPIINKANDKERRYAIKINSELVPVTKEVYSAFKRPAWKERKRRKVRADKERSFEQFMSDGFDIPSDYFFEGQLIDKLITSDMLSVITEDERCLIKDLYYSDLSLREVANKYGLYHNAIVYHRNRILKKLKSMNKL